MHVLAHAVGRTTLIDVELSGSRCASELGKMTEVLVMRELPMKVMRDCPVRRFNACPSRTWKPMPLGLTYQNRPTLA